MNRYNVNACENDSFRKASFEMKKKPSCLFCTWNSNLSCSCLLNPIVFLKRKERKESETQCVERRKRRKES